MTRRFVMKRRCCGSDWHMAFSLFRWPLGPHSTSFDSCVSYRHQVDAVRLPPWIYLR